MTTEPDLSAAAVSELSSLLQGLLPKIIVDSAILRLLLFEHIATRVEPHEAVVRYRDHLLNLLTVGTQDKAMAEAIGHEIRALFQLMENSLDQRDGFPLWLDGPSRNGR